MRANLLPVIVCLSLSSLPVAAAHITDKLVVGLYAEPSTEGTPVTLLSSGTPLEVLERRDDGFVRVRLADERSGWIESDYVTDEKPAKAMLLETQARLRQMGLELAALRERTAGGAAAPGDAQLLAERDAARAELAALRQAGDADAAARLQALQARVQRAVDLLAESPGVTPPVAQPSFMVRYGASIIGLAALVLGFVGGMAFSDYRLRRRHGGFRL